MHVDREERGRAANGDGRHREAGDLHLRSATEVTGYHVDVEDFILDDETWEIRYRVVDTRNWLPGKKALVAPRWIDQMSWGERPADHFRNHLDVLNGKNGLPQAQRETSPGTAFDTQEAREVKTYRDETRLESKTLGWG